MWSVGIGSGAYLLVLASMLAFGLLFAAAVLVPQPGAMVPPRAASTTSRATLVSAGALLLAGQWVMGSYLATGLVGRSEEGLLVLGSLLAVGALLLLAYAAARSCGCPPPGRVVGRRRSATGSGSPCS